MDLNRRQFLSASGALLTSCQSRGTSLSGRETSHLDDLLAAHADVLPEAVGAGANHYPMAAEVLEALGHASTIPLSWTRGARGYAGEPGRKAPIDAVTHGADALGAYDRYGDWLDCFRRELSSTHWRSVIATWIPRLTPGVGAGAFHGVIRTGHAVRALRATESAPRLDELAAALAYWAARYLELPTIGAVSGAHAGHETAFANLKFPWRDDDEDVSFFDVFERATREPLVYPVAPMRADKTPEAELTLLARDAAMAFLEMLIQERHRTWILHSVTAPGTVALLLPELDLPSSKRLVQYTWQGVLALYTSFAAPYTPRAHVREDPGEWPEIIERAVDRTVANASVHTIKLIDTLVRFDTDGDPVWRSAAAEWLDWT